MARQVRWVGSTRATPSPPKPEPEQYPWVVSVSDDRSAWVVQDGTGELNRTQRINLDTELEDGSRLTDEGHREFFDTAVEYLEIVRLYMPEVTAKIHRNRVDALLTFFYWLAQRHVGSLAEVTEDHIELYAEATVFGMEWTVGAPVRLIRFLQHEVRSGRMLPRLRQGEQKLDRRQIMKRAAIRKPGREGLRPICKRILSWVEENDLDIETEVSPEELIARWRPEPQTIQNIHRALLPIDELWIWKHQFWNPVLNFNPFPKGSMNIAARQGKESNLGATIPPKIAFPYLRWALTWVVQFGPIILEELERDTRGEQIVARLQEAGLEKEQAGRMLHKRNRIHNRGSLITLLAGACFVVIASLSARRLGEITNLVAGCTYEDSDGNFWLRIYIEKTLQDYDQIPVPAAVREAVMCMEQVSEEARMGSGHDSIWQYCSCIQKKTVNIRPKNYLNKLAKIMNEGSETPWRFLPHQFRRFFAMVYFWRYEKGDVAALSHHLRHFDLEMTRRYVTDTEFGRIWSDVEREYQGDFLRSVIAETRTIGGAAGRRITAKIERFKVQLRKDVQVVARERIAQMLLRLAKRWGTSCKMHVWGTICVCPERGTRKAARYAKCRGAEESGPVFSQASEETCATCPFAIHTERFQEHLKEARASRERLATGVTDGALIEQFVQASCESLDRALAREEMMPVRTAQEDVVAQE